MTSFAVWCMFGLVGLAYSAKCDYDATRRTFPPRGERLAAVASAAAVVLGGPVSLGLAMAR